MKTVGVISAYAYIEHHVNYGSLLQYFALQELLKEKGLFPYWIRYVLPEEHTQFYKIKRCIKRILNPVERDKEQGIRFQNEFIEMYLNLSDKFYCGNKQISSNPPMYDYYITGSDQVWGGCIEANYLRFTTKDKRISYAASFGREELSDVQKHIVPQWIREFKYVSVRELSGVALCDSIGVKAEWVADPTLLIDSEKYPFIKPTKEPRYFCYFINEFNVPNNIQKKLADSELIISGGIINIDDLFKNRTRVLSPEKWIGYIKSSKYILTNSFHGMIFSIIFKKPFLVFPQCGKAENQNNRLTSFLSYTGLEKRIYDDEYEIDQQLNIIIDWDYVYRKIESLKRKSNLFLDSSLEILNKGV